MANAEKSKSKEKAVWHVRNEQGEQFGPVDFQTLQAWAADGRLAPTNEISQNGTEWQRVTTRAGLGMDWVAEVTPGTFYGPIHGQAMRELVQDGSLSGETAFFTRQLLGTADRVRLEEEARAALTRERDAERERARGLEEQAARLRAEREARESEGEALRQRLAQAGEAAKALRERETAAVAAAADQAQRFEAERGQLREAVRRAELSLAEQAGRIASLEGDLACARREAERSETADRRVRALEEETAGLRQALEEARQQARESDARANREAGEGVGLRREVTEAAERLSEMQSRLDAQRKETDALRGEVSEARRRAETARALARRAAEALEAGSPQEGAVRVEAEPVDEPAGRGAETRTPHAQGADPKNVSEAAPRETRVVEPEVLAPERKRPAHDKPPVIRVASQAKPGLSLAELERQARRELERLGEQGKSFFKKK